MANYSNYTPIPTRLSKAIKITGALIDEEIRVPLATYETPLWASVNRGAKISQLCGGINVTLIDERMSRSIVMRCATAAVAKETLDDIQNNFHQLQQVVKQSSRYAQLLQVNAKIVGNLLFLRFECITGDASGHNMVTKAAEALINWLLTNYRQLDYGSISGNYCCDKKNSAVNSILGRGKNIVAEIIISNDILSKYLRTNAAKIIELNIAKNHIGSNIAGSVCSANAHFANMLLAFYLATGQDAANIVEGSQGIVHCEQRDAGALYFSCNLPNLIIGTVGNGKGQGLQVVEQHLQDLGCRAARAVGDNSRRLAAICAATVLCGELSLLAAQTNIGELMRSHLIMERNS